MPPLRTFAATPRRAFAAGIFFCQQRFGTAWAAGTDIVTYTSIAVRLGDGGRAAAQHRYRRARTAKHLPHTHHHRPAVLRYARTHRCYAHLPLRTGRAGGRLVRYLIYRRLTGTTLWYNRDAGGGSGARYSLAAIAFSRGADGVASPHAIWRSCAFAVFNGAVTTVA